MSGKSFAGSLSRAITARRLASSSRPASAFNSLAEIGSACGAMTCSGGSLVRARVNDSSSPVATGSIAQPWNRNPAWCTSKNALFGQNAGQLESPLGVCGRRRAREMPGTLWPGPPAVPGDPEPSLPACEAPSVESAVSRRDRLRVSPTRKQTAQNRRDGSTRDRSIRSAAPTGSEMHLRVRIAAAQK